MSIEMKLSVNYKTTSWLMFALPSMVHQVFPSFYRIITLRSHNAVENLLAPGRSQPVNF